MLLSGGTGLSDGTCEVNKPNYWPKACNIPVRYVALFSLQLVVIQPFPLDLFTTTNNKNHRYIYMKAFTYIYDFFWVVHRVVCLFLLGQLLAATTFFDFRVTTWEGGSSMRKDAESSS